MLTNMSFSLARKFLKFFYQACSQPWISHMLMGTVALLVMVYLQFWLLHDAIDWSCLASCKCQVGSVR